MGLILLPVLLSIFGPVDAEPNYTSAKLYPVSSVAVKNELSVVPALGLSDIEKEKTAKSDIAEMIV